MTELPHNKAAPKGAASYSSLHSIPGYSLTDAAISYAEAGLRVLPLRPNRKEPYGSLVRHGVKDASSDPVLVKRWWSLKPTANIGIATGDGLVVVDVDPRNGGVVDPAWPATLTARTASGGWHFYYRVEEEIKTSHGGMAPGVDLKAAGGYVVAPPSVRDGGSWTWDQAIPMTVASASVFQARPRNPRRSDRQLRNRDMGDSRFVPLEVIPEGQRHSELTRWAGWLRGQGYGASEIEEVLSVINASACAVPLDNEELDGIASWAGGLPV